VDQKIATGRTIAMEATIFTDWICQRQVKFDRLALQFTDLDSIKISLRPLPRRQLDACP
jgi:hypothetical protein